MLCCRRRSWPSLSSSDPVGGMIVNVIPRLPVIAHNGEVAGKPAARLARVLGSGDGEWENKGERERQERCRRGKAHRAKSADVAF